MTSENDPVPQEVEQVCALSSVHSEPLERVINLEAALARMGRDRGLLEDVGRFFLEDAPVLLGQMKVAAREGRVRDVAQHAHSLKGLASNFDAARAQRVAADIEQHGWASRLEAAAGLIGDLEREIGRVEQALRSELFAES